MAKSGYLYLVFLLLLASAQAKNAVPRLTVVISVDQMRADYLERFRPYFVEGGFKRLLTDGADFRNCHYQHAFTKTAPGHATILSGVHADVHGIIANDWMDRVDRITFVQINAVEDRNSPLVGLPPRAGRSPGGVLEAKSGRSPRNFLATTVGDRLKARYGAAAKVYGVADKDRAAILMAGPKADGAYWTEEGRFVTSTYYRPALPAWLEEFNQARGAAQHFGQTWDRLLDKSIYDAVQGPDDAPGEQMESAMAVTFPKRVDGGRPVISGTYYDAFDQTPWNNELVEDMAERLIEVEHLGEDDTPDLLCLGFSQTDKVGHAYGPDSHEVMDAYVRLDRVLVEFFQFLDRRIGLANCLIVLTADHGVAPLPERTQVQQGAGAAGRLNGAALDSHVTAALDAAFGPLPEGGSWWALHDNSGYHLNPLALQAKDLSAAQAAAKVREALLTHPMVAEAYTCEQLLAPGSLGKYDAALRYSYFPPRSPDVIYIPKPNFIERSPAGTTHGTPYEYDAHVPQVWLGAGIKAGVHPEPVNVEDIAPTLAGLLGVELPPEAKGRRLF